MPKETVATRAAFRAGVKGMRYTENPDPDFDIPVATDTLPGPNERHFETVERLPGLSDPEAAYEAGRALRMIGHILDSQGSPVEHGRHFLSQLANAVLTFALDAESASPGALKIPLSCFGRRSRPHPRTPRRRTTPSSPTRASDRSSKRGSNALPKNQIAVISGRSSAMISPPAKQRRRLHQPGMACRLIIISHRAILFASLRYFLRDFYEL